MIIDSIKMKKKTCENYENTLKIHENQPETMKQRRTKLLEKMNPFLIPQVEEADSTSRIMNLKCH